MIIGAIVAYADGHSTFVSMDFMGCRPEMSNEEIVDYIYGEHVRPELRGDLYNVLSCRLIWK